MSTEIEITDQSDAEMDEAALGTSDKSDDPIDLNDSQADTADANDLNAPTGPSGDADDAAEADTAMGEWSLCASMIFLAGYLVVVMFWVLDHHVWETLVSFDGEVYRTKFPVGVATILLLISVLSAFCSLISIVADKNNRPTLLIRILTLGPLLPTAAAGFLIWIIIQRGAGSSILENFLG
jgi:hypothetical protein